MCGLPLRSWWNVVRWWCNWSGWFRYNRCRSHVQNVEVVVVVQLEVEEPKVLLDIVKVVQLVEVDVHGDLEEVEPKYSSVAEVEGVLVVGDEQSV